MSITYVIGDDPHLSKAAKRRKRARAHAAVLANLRADRKAEQLARLKNPPRTRKTQTKAGRTGPYPKSASEMARKRATRGLGRRV